MKKVMFAALIFGAVAMTQVVNAQEPGRECRGTHSECVERDSTMRHERRAERMIQELGLSEEQVAQMNAANEEFMTTQKQTRETMREAREKRDAVMKSILTPEQYEKYTQMRSHRHGEKGTRHQMRHHRGHRPVVTPAVEGRQMRGGDCGRGCCHTTPAPQAETSAQ